VITRFPSEARGHIRRRKLEVWHSVLGRGPEDASTGALPLELLDEERLSPGAGRPRGPPRGGEVLTYVREGALAYEDSMGRSGVVRAGEFQRRSASRSVRHVEANASRTDGAHLFRIGLPAGAKTQEASLEQARFSSAQRRGVWCLIASPDGRRGSLHLHASACLYATMLDPGQHLVHELADGRDAWIHVVLGAVTLGDGLLAGGDGAGLSGERGVSVTARQPSELLLLDLGAAPTPC
jgi:quercetin 2,3-dioxygenase